MNVKTSIKKTTIERLDVRGPQDQFKPVLDALFAAGFRVLRSGPEVKDYRTTNRYHFIAERELSRKYLKALPTAEAGR